MEAVARKVLQSARNMVPGRFEVRPATRQSHPHVAWGDYDRMQQVMEGLGFRWLGDVEPESVSTDASFTRPNVLRLFVSHDGVMVAGFYRLALRWTIGGILGRLMGGGRGMVDVSSAFTDGTVLETSSAPLVGKWQSPPFLLREYQPQMHPGALVARHAQRVGEQMQWNPAAQPCRVQTLDEVVAVTDAVERKKREHRQSIGWITRDELAANGARADQVDKLDSIVRRIVAEEAAAAPAQPPHWASAAPPPAAAASTFVATPPVPPPHQPEQPAPQSAPPAPTQSPAAPAVEIPAPASAAPPSFGAAADLDLAESSVAAEIPPPDTPAIAASPVKADSGARQPRPLEEVIGRALVMNALVNVHFRAPVEVVRRWMEANGVVQHLSPRESALLAKPNADVTPEERAELRGYIEGLWALLWAGGVTDDLSPECGVPADMAALVPSLKKNEDGSVLSVRMRLRPLAELSRMLDVYDERHGDTAAGVAPAGSVAWIEQRRRALTWVLSPDANWDEVGAR